MPLPPMDRRFARACLFGALVATLVFAWVLFIGRTELAESRPASDFYDVQARALFDGHWDVPPETLSIEAFEVDGRAYMYFGPVPALLRMPVLALTDSLDGRLTQLSMLAAFVVTMLGISLLSWRVRSLVRAGDRVHRREGLVTALFVFATGAGSVVLFLASQAVVYHEAILWGVAWSLLAYHALVGFLIRPGGRRLVWASLFASLAFLTRASVGLGPVVALGLTLLVVVVARAPRDDKAMPSGVRWTAPGMVGQPTMSLVATALLAVLIPIGLYVAVNEIKFGELYRLPLEKQVFSNIDPDRQAALDANDDSLFGFAFVPTTAWQAARPDAIEFDGAAPWLTFPHSPPDVIGGATFDTLDESSSLTATMPLLVVLGAIGLVAVVRGRPSATGGLVGALRIPVGGAAVAFATTLTIAFVAHRYLGDGLPALVLLAVAGLHVCGRRFGAGRRPDGRRDRAAMAAGAAFVVLVMWGVAVNLALAVEYQRLIAPVDLAARRGFVSFQLDAPGRPAVIQADRVPPPAERGTLLVVGACDALLWSDGHRWYLLEGALDAGLARKSGPIVTEGGRSGDRLCATVTG